MGNPPPPSPGLSSTRLDSSAAMATAQAPLELQPACTQHRLRLRP